MILWYYYYHKTWYYVNHNLWFYGIHNQNKEGLCIAPATRLTAIS